jgi:hypothetical protein
VAIQLVFLLIGLASLPGYYQRVATRTVEPVLLYGQVMTDNDLIAQAAAERGVSPASYALYRGAFQAAAALIPAALALVILWRARRHWFAWFTAFTILFLGVSNLSDGISIARLIPFEVLGANDLFWFLILLFILLFPNGQLVPRWAGRLAVALVAYHAFIQFGTVAAYVAPEFAARAHLPTWGQPAFVWPVLLNFLVVLACQIYRYRRVSGPVERQQTKWFVFGFGLVIALILVGFVIGPHRGFLTDLVNRLLWLPLPIALAQAILRHRLYDIDVIIRRTLIYMVLTGLLVLAYFGTVLVLESVFRALTGQGQNSLVVVLSTLAIATLVGPLRRQVQAGIDRRFFRRKYDAAQTLAGFAASARDETDLERLSSHLVKVVDHTMQPESVELWLRPSGQIRKLHR